MFEFTLLKSLFFEMDRHKIEGITQTKEGLATFRRLEVSFPSAPEITSITAEERILPYVDRYYFYVNDEKVPTELKEPAIKQVIYEFYKKYHPDYLIEGLPEDMTEVNLLESFNVFHMPDYRPDHAFPGLITLDDLRSGKVHDDDKPKYAFPGLELFQGGKREEGQPMAASFDGYTAFDGDRESAKNKIEEMKKQFASQLEDLNIE